MPNACAVDGAVHRGKLGGDGLTVPAGAPPRGGEPSRSRTDRLAAVPLQAHRSDAEINEEQRDRPRRVTH